LRGFQKALTSIINAVKTIVFFILYGSHRWRAVGGPYGLQFSMLLPFFARQWFACATPRQSLANVNYFSRIKVKHGPSTSRSWSSMRSFSIAPVFQGQLANRPSANQRDSLTPIRTMSSAATKKTNDPYRLPTNVKPLHYNLFIKTDLEALKFEGHVAIE